MENFYLTIKLLFTICFIASVEIFSRGKDENPVFKIKAVNLGGWLVTEGWIKPSLFDGIPNKDFLDGTSLQFKSVTLGKYLCAEGGGGKTLVANRTDASGWETFALWRINETSFNFRVFNKQFIGLDNNGRVLAVSENPGRAETFRIVRNSNDTTRVRIKASNGYFLQVKTEELVTADYPSSHQSDWGDNNPSVFIMDFAGGLRGEFQVTNGYGPILAPKVMKEHWNTFVVEEDFKFISKHGLNAVRIPVGWWITSDPTPPRPYVGGSLRALDNAFKWAQKYGLKIIIDLHAAPGSQNGFEHSASRDGSQEWGETDASIRKTVAVIEFLAARYSNSLSLHAIQLINEPKAPLARVDTLSRYYKAGYSAVRKHSKTAYVIMASRVGDSTDPKEFLSLASGLKGSVIDVHYYSLYLDFFRQMNVQQNLDFIYKNRSAELASLLNSIPHGPTIFIGEWVNEWENREGKMKDYKEFAKAQLEVYGNATFGWAYWTLKNVYDHWNLEWMIKNDYIKL